MAVLTKARDTKARSQFSTHSMPMAAATKIYAGAMVAIDATGGVIPAATTAGLRVVGRADETVDNTAGVLAAKRILVTEGIYKWNNLGGAPVVATDLGKFVDVSDDNTVKTRAAGVKAGICTEIETDGVWVKSLLESTAV